MADWIDVRQTMEAVENWWHRATMRSSWENRSIGVDWSYLMENERMTIERERDEGPCPDLGALNVISKGYVDLNEHGKTYLLTTRTWTWQGLVGGLLFASAFVASLDVGDR